MICNLSLDFKFSKISSFFVEAIEVAVTFKTNSDIYVNNCNCQVLLILLPALGSGVPSRRTCRLLEANPFFKAAGRTSATTDYDVQVLTEFARFAQGRVPDMLAQFARFKRVQAAENPHVLLRSLRGGREFLFPAVPESRQADPTTTEAATETTTVVADDVTTTAAAETTTAAVEVATTEAAVETTTVTAETTAAAETTTVAAETTAAAETTTAADDETTTNGGEVVTTMAPRDIQASIEAAIGSIVNAVKDVLSQFKDNPLNIGNIQAIVFGVFEGVKDALAEFGIELPANIDIPPVNLPDITIPGLEPPTKFNLSDWPLLCKVIWWPKDEQHCQSMRCSACATPMLAASRACEMSEGQATAHCLRDVLGEGECGYCAIDYLQ